MGIIDNDFAMIYFVISVIVVGADVLTAFHAFGERKNFSHVLGVTCISAAVVQLTYLCSVFATDYFAASLLSSLYFVSIDFALLVLLTFIRAYVIKTPSSNLRNNLFKIGLGVFFFVDFALLILNPFKELMVTYEKVGESVPTYTFSQKPLYWLHLIYAYLLVVMILYYLIRRAFSIPKEYRRQYLLSVYSMLAVVLLNAVFLFYPTLFGVNLDYSIWGYSIITFLLYLNFFRYPIKGMKGYYNEWIIENVNQGVVMFNVDGILNIHNEKVHSIFPNSKIVEDMTITEFAKEINLDINLDRINEDYSFQHYVKMDGKEVPIRFDHRCMRNMKGESLGQLFVFTNETGDVDLLTSFFSWENFKQFIKDYPSIFVPPITVSVCDINGLGDINTTYGKNVGDQAIKILANTLRQEFAGETYFVRGQEATLVVLSFDIDAEEAGRKLENVQKTLMSETSLDCFLNIQSAVAVANEEDSNVLMVIKQAFKSMRNKKLLDTKSRKSELVTSLIKALAECDTDTEEHVKRTQLMGSELGKRLGLSDMQQSDLALLCILHDIGKIGIPLEILNKPSRLSDSEWRMMKTHTEKGYQIATSSQELTHLADMILHHHECWDGRGYPDGLSKESIPLLSRIISVVDSYDAMTNDRIYRPAMPVEDAIKELKRCAGSQFDPSIVSEFINMLPNIDTSVTEESLEILAASQNFSTNVETVSEEKNNRSNVHPVRYSRYIVDGSMNIVEIDDKFETLTGYSMDDIKERSITQMDLIPEDDRAEYIKLTSEELGRKDLAYFEHRIKRKDGSIFFVFCYGKKYYDSAVRAERSEIIIFDSGDTYAMKIMISEEQNKADLRLARWEEKYRCDSLTGLLNHEAFKSDVEMKLLEEGSRVMLLMMDVDKFKQYNDTYGHRAGDDFLIMVSQTLISTLRKDDLACRMGGDEFAAALFFGNEVDDEIMIERAKQICDKMNLVLSSTKGGTSLSMGVVLSTDKISTFNKLYETSDIALYEAKESGRAKMVLYKKD